VSTPESWQAGAAGACNVAGALAWQAQQRPGRTAMYYPTGIRKGYIDYHACSYRELDDLSDCWARGFKAIGIGRGVRAALMVPPGLDFFAVFFALFKAGAVPVLIDPGIGLKSLQTCLAEAAPEAFIGVTRAHAARALLRWAPASIRCKVTLGPRLGWGGHSKQQVLALGAGNGGPVLADTGPDEMAAILFTSGSTGIPKGVVYRHRHFVAQVEMLRQAFGIEPGDINLPTFPPFALFDPALGMTSVIPHMDPTRPARARPELLVQSIERFGVNTLFGSPALIRVLGDHAARNGLRLHGVKRVISAGAAVPTDVIRTLKAALPETARVFTPYVATECLPVSKISDEALSGDLEQRTRNGEGICVGRPVAPNRVRIIAVTDEAIPTFGPAECLTAGHTGEIVVHGPTATDSYWRRDKQTTLAKISSEDGSTWHRMGDVGYFDAEGRLWYCGRKSQRVRLDGETLFADQLEAIFNTHPDVLRSALVGVRRNDRTEAVLCIEARARLSSGQRTRIGQELLAMARENPRTQAIRTVLFHPGFPVDIRHNAKIGREQLAAWAAEKRR